MLCGNFCLCGKRSSGQKNALKISAFGVCCGVIISLLITTLMQLDTFHFALFLEAQLSCHENSVALCTQQLGLQRDNWLGQDGH